MEPIQSEQLPRWVPGKVLLDSDGLDWSGVSLRSYRYTGLDVEIPPMRDYMIITFRHGVTPISRRLGGPWSREHCEPGDVSLQTCSEPSHWHWTRDIDVFHVYLAPDMLVRVSSEALDRDVANVCLQDVLKTRDPVISGTARAIATEIEQQGLGGRLYVEALATQLSVHLLRHYASVDCRRRSRPGALSPVQAQRVAEYVEAHLDSSLRLEELAGIAGLSTWHFLRQFRGHFGVAPHAYVMQRRIERARGLLVRGALPLKEIAACCGFSDQAHMTRLFRRHLGVTPATVRASAA